VTGSESSGDALLSVCIPTYNRASSLRNLFTTLVPVKQRFGDEIEFCVSNNASPDDTRAVIEEFAAPLELRVVHQSRNIGGTLNIIEVAQLARGRWGMFLGDDDELLIDAVADLLQFLRGGAAPNWVLIEAQNIDGSPLYLRRFREGSYGRGSFRRRLLVSGMNPFGFMGVHVFRRTALTTFKSLDLENARPWPHVACMFRELSSSDSRVHVLRRPMMVQAADAKLFWAGGDLARIRLDKIRVIMRAYRNGSGGFIFFHLLMLREMYSRTSFTSLLSWKLYEPADFDARGFATYLSAYSWLGACGPLALPHALLMVIVRVIPGGLYAALFRWIGLGRFRRRYEVDKRELGAFDGIKRGI
jgi:glycosyltransferase involved in cell wall biosynthesis